MQKGFWCTWTERCTGAREGYTGAKQGCTGARDSRSPDGQKPPCKPVPLNLGGAPNLGGGLSEIPCFTVFFEGRPLNLGCEMSLPKFRGYGLTGPFAPSPHRFGQV